MSAYKTWAAKQRGNPLLLIVAAAGFTGGFYFLYKRTYSPWKTRRRLAESEDFAELLYKKEAQKD